MLVDSHCHLDYPPMADDVAGALARARSAGVGTLLTISTRVRAFAALKAIVEAHEDVFCSIGTHPHNAEEERDIPAEDILALTTHPKVVAIGEAGLDYFRQWCPFEDQERGFRKHIAVARATQLPLVIHARDADEDMARILEEETNKGPFPALLHCFTGGPDLARRALALGLYISFSGVITFKRNEDLRAIAASVPLDRILVETDAPYLAPEPHRGKTNEPAYVAHTARALADARGMSQDAIAQATTDNFFRLFAKARRPAAKPEHAAA